MAASEMKINIKADYRPCFVMLRDGTQKKGMFHQWAYNNGCVGLVEDVDGKMHLVQPQRIQFADDAGFNDYAWGDEEPEYDDADDISSQINRIINLGDEV